MSSSSASTSNLFTRVHYRDHGGTVRPHLLYGDTALMPLGKVLSITFDTAVRYCLGWHDLSTSQSHPCPDTATTDAKYGTCQACQKRTGFNPAFYHAASVSPQQERLNQELHILYLAHFGDDYIKVGISRKKRGLNRLYEQGARSALILDTFPTALVARQYEALIAKLPGIHETTAVRTKRAFLEQPYDADAAAAVLITARQQIEDNLKVSFSTSSPQSFDHVYFSKHYQPEPFTTLPDASKIAGTCLGLIGDVLIMQYNDHRLAIHFKQFYGYPVALTDSPIDLIFSPTQTSLF